MLKLFDLGTTIYKVLINTLGYGLIIAWACFQTEKSVTSVFGYQLQNHKKRKNGINVHFIIFRPNAFKVT
jgi:hypothetical protein